MTVDSLVRDWKQATGKVDIILRNDPLIRFLGEWLFSEYQPFPEKADFRTRLFSWLDQIPDCDTKAKDQQAMFNFIPQLLFAAERDLTSMYRAAFDGPIRRWLIDCMSIDLETPDIDVYLSTARNTTWFGSLAGMDINSFCRVNRIQGQSFRPEFRFVSSFCDAKKLSRWLKRENYKRIVVVEDMVGTGEQFEQALPVLTNLKMKTLFVPLFIPPDGAKFVREKLAKKGNEHIDFEPIFELPSSCIISRDEQDDDADVVIDFREVIDRHGRGHYGYGDDYGTLVLSYLNCPDNVPGIIYRPPEIGLFPRASREG